MRLDRYIAKSRIIDLNTRDFRGALQELLAVCSLPEREGGSLDQLTEELIRRERNITTYLGKGIALPHIRIPMKRPYVFAVGRCPQGLEFEGNSEYRQVRLLFLLLAASGEPNYLNVLASLARIFQEPTLGERLTSATTLSVLKNVIAEVFAPSEAAQADKDNKFNRLIIREALKVAQGARCSAVMIFGDTFSGPIDLSEEFAEFKTILVTQASTEATLDKGGSRAVIPVRSFSNARLSQLRSAMLIGLTRNIIQPSERICCVGGLPESNQFDTIVVVDVEREFQSVLTQHSNLLPPGVKPEVLERVMAIATELSVEGREGKPVGCLFIVGATDEMASHTKQLVLNPFYGYEEEERNILNPFMDETLKEFSSIDGAFIIRGDGVIESAGTLLHNAEYPMELPSGLGSRHAAAAGISVATQALAIVVSASTGQVTLFRRGQMLPIISRSLRADI